MMISEADKLIAGKEYMGEQLSKMFSQRNRAIIHIFCVDMVVEFIQVVPGLSNGRMNELIRLKSIERSQENFEAIFRFLGNYF